MAKPWRRLFGKYQRMPRLPVRTEQPVWSGSEANTLNSLESVCVASHRLPAYRAQRRGARIQPSGAWEAEGRGCGSPSGYPCAALT